MTDIAIFAIGFLAQGFFSTRVLVQWIMSERARKVLSPTIFWVLSIAGAYLMCLYGWLRDDFAIILGQLISYYVYLWNLDAKGIWRRINIWIRWLLILTPVTAMACASGGASAFYHHFIHNEEMPLWLLLFGSAGQILFVFRFVYQWLYSRKAHESVLPAGFWIISMVGSLSIAVYGFIRKDPVLILGQSFGIVAYARNLMILYQSRRDPADSPSPTEAE